jgi:hypothetical protein
MNDNGGFRIYCRTIISVLLPLSTSRAQLRFFEIACVLRVSGYGGGLPVAPFDPAVGTLSSPYNYSIGYPDHYFGALDGRHHPSVPTPASLLTPVWQSVRKRLLPLIALVFPRGFESSHPFTGIPSPISASLDFTSRALPVAPHCLAVPLRRKHGPPGFWCDSLSATPGLN